MNVAVVSYFFSAPGQPAVCGPAVSAYNIARELAKYAEVHVFCAGPDAGQAVVAKGFVVHPIRTGRLTGHLEKDIHTFLAFNRAVPKALAEGGFDIINTHGWITGFAPAYKKLSGCRWVHTVHAVEKLRMRSMELDRKTRHTIEQMEAGVRQADGFIAVSRDVGRGLAATYGIPAGKIHTIPNGVDTTLFRPGRKDRTVLFVGRLSREKGIHLLIEALPVVLQTDKTARFVVVAPVSPAHRKAPAFLRLREQIRMMERAFPGRVTVVEDFLSQKKLARLYAAAAVFVLPSLYESFGMALVEAMAAGCAVVATRVGGMKEIVNSRNGVLIRPDAKELAETVLALLEDNGRVRRLARQAARTSTP